MRTAGYEDHLCIATARNRIVGFNCTYFSGESDEDEKMNWMPKTVNTTKKKTHNKINRKKKKKTKYQYMDNETHTQKKSFMTVVTHYLVLGIRQELVRTRQMVSDRT